MGQRRTFICRKGNRAFSQCGHRDNFHMVTCTIRPREEQPNGTPLWTILMFCSTSSPFYNNVPPSMEQIRNRHTDYNENNAQKSLSLSHGSGTHILFESSNNVATTTTTKEFFPTNKGTTQQQPRAVEATIANHREFIARISCFHTPSSQICSSLCCFTFRKAEINSI